MHQRSDNQFLLERQRVGAHQIVVEGERTEGWMTVEDDQVGAGVGLRYMPEEYPKALRTTGTGKGIDVYLWKGVDGKTAQSQAIWRGNVVGRR